VLISVNQGDVESERLHRRLHSIGQSEVAETESLKMQLRTLACARLSAFEKSSKMYSKLVWS
jgi:hypothetical protein